MGLELYLGLVLPTAAASLAVSSAASLRFLSHFLLFNIICCCFFGGIVRHQCFPSAYNYIDRHSLHFLKPLQRCHGE